MNIQAENQYDWESLKTKVKSLFSPAAPISEKDLFAGRKEQIRRLLDAIAENGRHAILYGERGVGKTSLTNIVHLIAGTVLKMNIFPLRKQASPVDDYNALWMKIFRDITYTSTDSIDYGKERTTNHTIADVYKDKITPDDVVRELAKISNYYIPVIIFDEFDKIESNETKQLMAHTIKALSDSGIKATIIIVGVADDINVLVTEHESIKRNIEEIKMPRMSKNELEEILKERLPQLGLTIEDDARWKIITLARGLPEYVHLLGCGAAIQAITSHRMNIIEDDVNLAIDKMLHQSDQSSSNTYKQAIHSNRQDALYQKVLLACAMAVTDDEGRFTPTSVVEPLSKLLNRSVPISAFQSHLKAFCGEDRGKILEQHGVARAFKYRFREPKMQPYVIMQGINSEDINSDALSILSPKE